MKKVKRFLILLGLLIFTYNGFSQTTKRDDFDKFIKYFPKLESGKALLKSSHEIPVEFIKSILGKDFYNDYIVSYEAFGILNKEKNITLLMEFGLPSGGYSSEFLIFTFSPSSGMIIKSQRIGSNFRDNDGGGCCSLFFPYDSLLVVYTYEKYKIPDKDEYRISDENYNYYIINDSEFKSYFIPSISKNRNYPLSSGKILDEEELLKFSKDELDIIRNEIFADHGYIFKTEKWKKYFDQFNWYKPRFEDVTNKLTIIEKINIENILKIAPL